MVGARLRAEPRRGGGSDGALSPPALLRVSVRKPPGHDAAATMPLPCARGAGLSPSASSA